MTKHINLDKKKTDTMCTEREKKLLKVKTEQIHYKNQNIKLLKKKSRRGWNEK